MNLENIQKVHIIGIGGIGISAVAKLFKKLGKEVSGSDLEETEITKELLERDIDVFIGHDESNLSEEVDLVIYSSAVPEDNPERKRLKELEIEEMSYPEFLGDLSRDKWTIAVSGTNGKTTTTAMLGLALDGDEFDPTVIVGSKLKNFEDGNLRVGQSEYFVVEACEYQANMLNIWPQMIVLTNIEEDHLDYYKDLIDIKNKFKEFLEHLPECGYLVYNIDDPVCAELAQLAEDRAISFGIESDADLKAVNIEIKDERQYFDLVYKGEKIEGFSLQVPGRFNIYNALGAVCAALILGVEPEVLRKSLSEFNGIWRRFEKIEEKDGSLVISDYGHHPTAVRGTLEAARDFYPDKNLIIAFQPHHHNRTKNLFVDFIESFEGANTVILNEIYDVAGRDEDKDQDISSKDLVEAIKKKNEIEKREQEIVFSANLDETLSKIKENLTGNDLVVVMGAGEIYKIAKDVL